MPLSPLLSDVFFYRVVHDFLTLQFTLEIVISYISNRKLYDSTVAVYIAFYEFVFLSPHKESALSIIIQLHCSTLLRIISYSH